MSIIPTASQREFSIASYIFATNSPFGKNLEKVFLFEYLFLNACASALPREARISLMVILFEICGMVTLPSL